MQNKAGEEDAVARYTTAALGLVLMAGGALTLYDSFATDPAENWGSLGLMLLAEAEVFAGLWLAVERGSERARPWAVAVLLGLWAASLYQVLTGRCSCGRFGGLAVSPWITLLFDTAALAILLRWYRIEGQDDAMPSGAPQLTGLALAAVLAGFTGLGQPDRISASGTASQGRRPLDDATLNFIGPSAKFRVQTDHAGRFRLPPIQPGRYTVVLVKRSNGAPGPGKDKGGKKAMTLVKITDCSSDNLEIDFSR